MTLRVKILINFIIIAVIAILLFGVNAYNIVRDISLATEQHFLNENARVRERMLAIEAEHNSSIEYLKRYANASMAKGEIVVILDKNNRVLTDLRAHSASANFLSIWQTDDTRGLTHGTITVGDQIYIWAALDVTDSDYRLLNAIPSQNTSAETLKRLAIRLFTLGAIILWGASWVIVIIATAVSKKLEEQTAALHKQANYDAGTGLVNRAYFNRILAGAIEDAEKQSGSLVLMVLDLDRFKEVNDTLGNQVGDVLLGMVAERLTETLRDKDKIARLGGDEFAVLLPVTDNSHCALVVNKVQQAFSKPFVINDITLEMSATIGIALYPENSKNPTELIGHAEVAMFDAQQRHELFAYYDPAIDPHSEGRLLLINDLKYAAEREELYLCYQPLIDVMTHKVIGVEALVRWKSPTRGLVMPDRFIPVAEQTGIIKLMTYYIIDKAVEQCALWLKQGIELSMSVNLSARLVHDPNIPEVVRKALSKHGLDPSYFELEITETAVMLDPVRAMDVLNKLDSMGVYLSIDDFGSGYTSLAYLKKLPVDAVKIDRSFVMNMLRDANDALVVHSIIDLAHNMSRSVVAEGVENKKILDELVLLNCNTAQGYHFTKPVPAKEFELWLEKYNNQKNEPRASGLGNR